MKEMNLSSSYNEVVDYAYIPCPLILCPPAKGSFLLKKYRLRLREPHSRRRGEECRARFTLSAADL